MKNIGIIGMGSMVNMEIAAQILKKDNTVILKFMGIISLMINIYQLYLLLTHKIIYF